MILLLINISNNSNYKLSNKQINKKINQKVNSYWNNTNNKD